MFELEEDCEPERTVGLLERLAPDDVERLILELLGDTVEDRRTELLLDFREELLTELLDGLLEVRREVLLDGRLLRELPDDRRDELLTALLERRLPLELRLTDPLELRELELFEELTELDRLEELLLLPPPPFPFANAPSRATNPKKNTAEITTRSKRLWYILRSMANSFLPGISRRSIRRLMDPGFRIYSFYQASNVLDRPRTGRLE